MGWVGKKSRIDDHGEKREGGGGGTVPMRLILIHVYTDCAFKINLERGWGTKLQRAVKAVCVTGLFFWKLLKPFSWNIQVGRAPLPVSHSIEIKVLSRCLRPSLYLHYVFGCCWKIQGKAHSRAILIFSELWFKGHDNVVLSVVFHFGSLRNE